MENCVFRGDNGLDPGFRKGRGGGGEVKNGCGEEGRPWVIADAENSLVGEGKNKKKRSTQNSGMEMAMGADLHSVGVSKKAGQTGDGSQSKVGDEFRGRSRIGRGRLPSSRR